MFISKIDKMVRDQEVAFNPKAFRKLRNFKRLRKLNPKSQQILKALECSHNVKDFTISEYYCGEDTISYYTKPGSRFQDVLIKLDYGIDTAKQFYDPYHDVPPEEQTLIAFNAFIENPTVADTEAVKTPEGVWFKLHTNDVNEIVKLIDDKIPLPYEYEIKVILDDPKHPHLGSIGCLELIKTLKDYYEKELGHDSNQRVGRLIAPAMVKLGYKKTHTRDGGVWKK